MGDSRGGMRGRWSADRQTTLTTIGLGVLLVLPLTVRRVGWVWEWASVCGLLSAVGALALCAWAVRPREARPAAPLSLNRHRDLGFAVLGLAVAHVGLLLWTDPTVVEYLMPTAPGYQLAGIAALVLLVILGATSTGGTRRRVWSSHRGFQVVHVVLSLLAIALISGHVLVSARYAHMPRAGSAFLAVSIVAMLLLLRQRKGAAHQSGADHLIGRAAFGRHSAAVVGVIIVVSLALLGLLSPSVRTALQSTVIPRKDPIPMNFPHDKHRAVQCLTCHHNFTDKTGRDGCISCHRGRHRTDLKMPLEPRFHQFCLECHRTGNEADHKNGPAAGCVVCHSEPH